MQILPFPIYNFPVLAVQFRDFKKRILRPTFESYETHHRDLSRLSFIPFHLLYPRLGDFLSSSSPP